MQHPETLVALVDKAAQTVGSEAKLAKAMGIPQSHISNWKAGDRTCTPEDRARLAGFAREDALQELVRAVLEKTAGTLRGEQLRQVLGKSLHQIIAGVGIALLLAGSLTFGSADAIGAVALFTFFLYSTMYIMLSNICIMPKHPKASRRSRKTAVIGSISFAVTLFWSWRSIRLCHVNGRLCIRFRFGKR